MKYFISSSFRKIYKKLPVDKQNNIDEATRKLVECFEKSTIIPGLGLKHLRYDLWEIRVGLQERIIFRRGKDIIEFLMCGGHDDIKKFLKRI